MVQIGSPPAPRTGNPVPDELGNGNGTADPITHEASGSDGSGTDSQPEGVNVSGENAGSATVSRSPSPNVEPDPQRPQSPAQQDEHLTQVLAGYALLTPEQQLEISRLINPSEPVVKAPAPLSVAKSSRSSPLFSDEAERPAPSSGGEHKFGIHPEIVRLAEHRVHLPLTLFLAQSQKELFLKPNLAREHIIYNGTKTYIIKVDQFPDESRMDPTDWMEAWSNYLAFLELEASHKVYFRWQTHFKFLSSHQDLRRHFPHPWQQI